MGKDGENRKKIEKDGGEVEKGGGGWKRMEEDERR